MIGVVREESLEKERVTREVDLLGEKMRIRADVVGEMILIQEPEPPLSGASPSHRDRISLGLVAFGHGF